MILLADLISKFYIKKLTNFPFGAGSPAVHLFLERRTRDVGVGRARSMEVPPFGGPIPESPLEAFLKK